MAQGANCFLLTLHFKHLKMSKKKANKWLKTAKNSDNQTRIFSPKMLISSLFLDVLLAKIFTVAWAGLFSKKPRTLLRLRYSSVLNCRGSLQFFNPNNIKLHPQAWHPAILRNLLIVIYTFMNYIHAATPHPIPFYLINIICDPTLLLSTKVCFVPLILGHRCNS